MAILNNMKTITKKIKLKKNDWAEIFITYGKRKFVVSLYKSQISFIEAFDKDYLDQKILYINGR